MRAVDLYRLEAWGLYMARPTPGRAQFHYLESWLLPALGLRVNVFHFNAGHERDEDYYLDVCDIAPGEDVWRTEDHYLDLVHRTGQGTELVDVDELLDAHRLGLLSSQTAERAIRRAVHAVQGLSEHEHRLDRWLEGHGMQLTWSGA